MTLTFPRRFVSLLAASAFCPLPCRRPYSGNMRRSAQHAIFYLEHGGRAMPRSSCPEFSLPTSSQAYISGLRADLPENSIVFASLLLWVIVLITIMVK
jgi:hypothetical protein